MQKTKIEIINETAEFYNLTNRGIEKGEERCKYKTKDGKMCAVGRCMIDVDWKEDFLGGVFGITSSKGLLDNFLKPEYQGHPHAFWSELQDFHDEEYNFTHAGLSDSGNSQKKYLLEKYQ